MRFATPVLCALPLAACMTAAEPPAAPERPEGGTCNADAVQHFLGKNATADAGSAILEESGARTLRWGSPNSAWTMDYRQDRVNVRYDDDMVIEEINCG